MLTNKVIELVRVGYIAPRMFIICLCCVWLFGLGLMAKRVFTPGRYSPVLRAMYVACVPLYLVAALWAAMTI